MRRLDETAISASVLFCCSLVSCYRYFLLTHGEEVLEANPRHRRHSRRRRHRPTDQSPDRRPAGSDRLYEAACDVSIFCREPGVCDCPIYRYACVYFHRRTDPNPSHRPSGTDRRRARFHDARAFYSMLRAAAYFYFTRRTSPSPRGRFYSKFGAVLIFHGMQHGSASRCGRPIYLTAQWIGSEYLTMSRFLYEYRDEFWRFSRLPLLTQSIGPRRMELRTRLLFR